MCVCVWREREIQKEERDGVRESLCADENSFHSVANIIISQLTCEALVMQLMSLFKLDKIIVSLAGNLLILWLCHLLFSKPAAAVAFVEKMGWEETRTR